MPSSPLQFVNALGGASFRKTHPGTWRVAGDPAFPLRARPTLILIGPSKDKPAGDTSARPTIKDRGVARQRNYCSAAALHTVSSVLPDTSNPHFSPQNGS
jgi:hypothetical protein